MDEIRVWNDGITVRRRIDLPWKCDTLSDAMKVAGVKFLSPHPDDCFLTARRVWFSDDGMSVEVEYHGPQYKDRTLEALI